jgi:hypothetical protein
MDALFSNLADLGVFIPTVCRAARAFETLRGPKGIPELLDFLHSVRNARAPVLDDLPDFVLYYPRIEPLLRVAARDALLAAVRDLRLLRDDGDFDGLGVRRRLLLGEFPISARRCRVSDARSEMV